MRELEIETRTAIFINFQKFVKTTVFDSIIYNIQNSFASDNFSMLFIIFDDTAP